MGTAWSRQGVCAASDPLSQASAPSTPAPQTSPRQEGKFALGDDFCPSCGRPCTALTRWTPGICGSLRAFPSAQLTGAHVPESRRRLLVALAGGLNHYLAAGAPVMES